MTKYIGELLLYRELIIALTLREIKVRYKQTIMGSSWAILQPVALTLIFTIVFGFFLKVSSEDIPYPIFAYSALLPWTFFTTSVSFGSQSVVNNANLVTKVYFPREILPISSLGGALFDLLIASVIFILMMFYYKVTFTPNIFFLLLIIPTIIIFTTGITFILSTLNVIFRDIKFVVPLMLQIWLYASPIIYSMNQVPDNIRRFYILNPMAPLLQSFRDVTVGGIMPNIFELSLAVGISVFIFIFGYLFFKYKEKIFADVI